MKDKIEARSDFEAKIKKNPIELLKAIKQHALNYQENRYNMAIVWDAMTALMKTVQKEGENLQDYTRRFRVAKHVMESHIGGPIILSKIVENMPGYDEKNKDRCEKYQRDAYGKLMAYVYLHNADQAKYGSILRGLNTQQSLGNNQYPKTITEANSVLSSHTFDNTPKGKMGQGNNNDKQKEKKQEKEEESPTLSFAQMEGKCYCCGKPGHKSPQCRKKDSIPKEQWAINVAKKSEQQSHNQTSQSSNNKSNEGQQSSEATGWAGAHIQFYQAQEMRDVILLDNQLTTTIFCNPDLVENIHESDETMMLTTNAGVITTNLKATIPSWGEAWFSPKAITNIFSYAKMADRYKITYDSEKEDAFLVHLPNKIVKFQRDFNGLYVFKPNIKTKVRDGVQFITTLEENRTFYTTRQFDRAKRARDLFHALGTPSIQDFKAIIRINAIRDNPVTTEDIELAEKIFGPDIGMLKGKTTRTKPIPVVSNRIDIPRELINAQREVVLCIDGFKVNNQPFLATISRNLYYRVRCVRRMIL